MCLNLQTIYPATDQLKNKTVIVAISGGSDSTALLFLVKNSNIELKQLIAITIDHKLRPESAAEAQQVARLCEKHGIEHQIYEINWQDNPKKGNLSSQSRYLRYKILYNCSKKYSEPAILTGHTINDCIETHYMRQSRGSTIGLASIAYFSLLYDDVPLIRPLLNVSRETLRNYLNKLKLNWIEDPTNSNILYERAAIRQKLAKQNLIKDFPQWQARLEQQRQNRYIFSTKIAQELQNSQTKFQYEMLTIQPSEISNHSLAILASLIGGSTHLPSGFQLQQIANIINCSSSKPKLFSVAGAIIEKRKSGKYLIYREARNLKQCCCPANSELIWDNRFLIKNNSTTSLIIRPSTTAEAIKLKQKYPLLPSSSSQQRYLTIEHNDNIYYPIIEGSLPANIEISYHYSLYSWLVSGFDIAIFNEIKKIYLLP